MARQKAKPPARQWGQLTRATRRRYMQAADGWGLTPRQARERFNRGTWKPGSADPQQQRPREWRGVDLRLLRIAAMRNVEGKLQAYQVRGRTVAFNLPETRARVAAAKPAAWRFLAAAGPEQLREWAAAQLTAAGLPASGYDRSWDIAAGDQAWLWYRSHGKWVNAAWYR